MQAVQYLHCTICILVLMKPLKSSAAVALVLAVAGVFGLVAVSVGGTLSLTAATVSLGQSTFAVGLRIDVLSATLLVFVALLGFLIATYSLRNLRGQRRVARFGWLLSASYLSLTALVCGASLPVMAAGWTASGLLLTGLISHRGTPRAVRAASSVRGRLLVGDGFLWAAVLVAALTLPSLDRAGLGASVAATSPWPVALIALLLVAACVVRSALIPAWSWLPQTAEAPSPVSAYLHAGVVNGAGVLVALMWPLFRAAPAALAALTVFGAISAVVGTAAARTRPDVKSQLACSTTSQMGYMCIQLGLGLPAVAVLHLVGHGFYKAWLFLRAGGEVTRHRELPVSIPMPRTRTLLGVATAVLIPVAVLLAILPIPRSMLESFGPVAIVPFLAAGSSTAAAICAATTLRLGAPRKIALTVLSAALALGIYLVAVGEWEHWLSPALPANAVWAPVVAATWLTLLACAAGSAMLLARTVTTSPDSVWALRLLASALPPAARALPGTASALPPLVPASPLQIEHTRRMVNAVSYLSSPAFPLRAFVAANPLAGLETASFDLAADIAATWSARSYLSPAEYHDLYDSGRITDADLQQAADSTSGSSLLTHGAIGSTWQRPPASANTLCERGGGLTPRSGWALADIAQAHAGLWCAHVWGQSNWSPKANEDSDGLYRRWHRACTSDSWGALCGIQRADQLAGCLSDDPTQALTSMLAALPADVAPFAYLCRLLTVAPGWAGHASWRVREGHTEAVIELLAFRMALDLAISSEGPSPLILATGPSPAAVPDTDSPALWQRALELNYQNRLVHSLSERAAQPLPTPESPSSAQFVFCIDVRSERLRRHLESTGPYDTYGFAGFFGAAVRYQAPSGQHFDQYPVLLSPACVVRSAAPLPTARYAYTAAANAGKAPLTGYALAEASGLLTGIASLTQTLVPRAFGRAAQLVNPSAAPEGLPALAPAHGHQPISALLPEGMGLDEQIQLAESALRAIGLTEQFAALLVITAHASTVQNNAFAAGYDCGACGGNAGLVNARLLADALNSAPVRDALAARGIVIPAHCQAVAAVHNTTTDDLTIEANHVHGQAATVIGQLRVDLHTAAALSASERCSDLPGAPRAAEGARALRHVAARAHDWSEPVPEWGLAGNAAFIAGPRWLTQSMNLGGRVFLHSYDPDSDIELAVLSTIINAPVVVAQWINAQYFFSAVDPDTYGAGDKSTHNVVGDIGVLTGAYGDLRTGLPWQTLFSRESDIGTAVGRHEPLRLSVILYSRTRDIATVIEASPHVRALVCNQWIHLIAIDPDTGTASALNTDLTWQPWDSTTMDAQVTAHSAT